MFNKIREIILNNYMQFITKNFYRKLPQAGGEAWI
jgi:hypothetical protein